MTPSNGAVDAMSGGAYRFTVRQGPRVDRERHPTLAAALDALDARIADLHGAARHAAVDIRIRRFEPGELVAARLEVSGPGWLWPAVRAGVDLRGDGSELAWTGRAGRTPIETEDGESAASALRRVLAAEAEMS